MSLAKEALKNGYTVAVATNVDTFEDEIKANNITVFPLKNHKRSNINLIDNIKSIIEIHNIYKMWKPDIVHHISMKCILLGTFASFKNNIKMSVNSITGFGYIYTSSKSKAKLLRYLFIFFLKFIFSYTNAKVIVQNTRDFEVIKKYIRHKNNLFLIKGSGVNTKIFKKFQIASKSNNIVFIGRMLFSKGVKDFVDVARIFNKNKLNKKKFILVGGTDSENPDHVPQNTLMKWKKEGCVDWLDNVKDVPKILKNAKLVCFPSQYGEGIPKALIEAASCGRPIIAYDIPGCKEIVKNGKNGFLIQSNDIKGISIAIDKIFSYKDTELQKIAKFSSDMVIKEFSEEVIFKQIIGIYDKVKCSKK